MKARNPQTGNLEEVYVKALDSMPVGTQVEYTGSTIPVGWEQVSGKNQIGYLLYENSSGSNANITLSDNVTNYEYLEIYYRSNDNYYHCSKFPANITYTDLTAFQPNEKSDSAMYMKMRVIKLNGTSIETRPDYYKEVKLDSNDNSITNFQNNYIYITKVIGYKEV